MAHARSGKYADFEGLREQAVALRRAGLSLRQIRDELKIFNNDILNQLVEGEPPPEWTKRPRAKDDLRERARELRLQGWTYDRIEAELGCSKSSVSLWVRDLPRPERRDPTEQAKLADASAGNMNRRYGTRSDSKPGRPPRERSERCRAGTYFMAGVALYWAEGQKSKPYQRREAVVFVNSDPSVIQVYLAWLDLLDVTRAAVPRHDPRNRRRGRRRATLGRPRRHRRVRPPEDDPQEAQPEDRPQEHRRRLSRLSCHSSSPSSRVVPSHRGLVVRHSRCRDVSGLTKCLF